MMRRYIDIVENAFIPVRGQRRVGPLVVPVETEAALNPDFRTIRANDA